MFSSDMKRAIPVLLTTLRLLLGPLALVVALQGGRGNFRAAPRHRHPVGHL